MAIVVNAGNFVQANVTIQNIGQQAGTFRLTAVVVPVGGDPATDVVQTFYNASGFSPSNPPPAGADFVDSPSAIAPNDSVQLTMFSDSWGGGDPLTYTTDEIFDVVFFVTVLETSEVFEFRGDQALQHQSLAPAQPTIVGVDYVVQAA